MTVNWILQNGQTGVARGAWAAAKALGIQCGGVMSNTFTDENGIIPAGVRMSMRPSDFAGVDYPIKENIQFASCLLVVVPNRLRPVDPDTTYALNYAAARPGLQVMLASRGDELAVGDWLAHLPFSAWRQSASRSGHFFLTVIGPRASAWPEGEGVALDLVREALRCQPPT